MYGRLHASWGLERCLEEVYSKSKLKDREVVELRFENPPGLPFWLEATDVGGGRTLSVAGMLFMRRE